MGGTNLRIGMVSDDGTLIRLIRAPSPTDRTPAEGLDVIRDLVQALVDSTGVIPEAAGVGIPGPAVDTEGTIDMLPNLPGWRGVPLAAELRRRLSWPIVVENDANLAALGESRWGAECRGLDLIMITLGTGVGGGVILGGRIWHGALGYAGELGHMTISLDGPVCGCGNQGCLEAFAGKAAIVRRGCRLRERWGGTVSDGCGAEDGELTPAAIAEAAQRGEEWAKETLDQTGRYLGVGIANLICVLNVGTVCVSGGIAGAGELILAAARKEVLRRAFATPARATRIVVGRLPEPGVLGAAGLALTRVS